MEVTVGLFLVIVCIAFCCEFVDSCLGMGYGTVLSPVLIIMGFSPVLAVSSILLSQAAGGFTASVFHHKFRNADFRPQSKDLKIAMIITACGIAATIFAAIIAVAIPRTVLKTYIGVLVLIMGIILLTGKKFSFSWKNIIGVGIVSAFNKGLTGGGFGPVVTSGQIISGHDHKAAIGITTLAEVPICTAGFIAYILTGLIANLHGSLLDLPVRNVFTAVFTKGIFQWELTLALLIGAVLVAPFGAFTTKNIHTAKLTWVLGILVSALGLWTLIKTYI